ncbi:MAG: AgmX/PglI C-terminal domain-containing protein [Myxococcota bacterium]|nr:AgmX/PglI C-terminal domain-containing protein [Myxococcota bacterium]
MLSVLWLWGCVTTPEGGSHIEDGVIHVSTGETSAEAPAPMSMQERIRLAFRDSQPRLVECYRPALERDPMRYGELVVGVSISPAGEVTEAQVVFSTISDADMVECVLSTTKGFSFPTHSREVIRASYPFLFTSDATPPEVVRALKVRHGLIPPDPAINEDIDAEPARGQEGWYETW